MSELDRDALIAWLRSPQCAIYDSDAADAIIAALERTERYRGALSRIADIEVDGGPSRLKAGQLARAALEGRDAAVQTVGLVEPKQPKAHPISTRRVDNGTVHEMADLGVGTLCGQQLPEPWTWTDDPVSCDHCLACLATRGEFRAALEGRDG